MTDHPEDTPPEEVTPQEAVAPDAEEISGVGNWIEEGGPLEPSDVSDVSEAAGAESADELVVTRIALEERTLDLQRKQAEFLNYKRRVERDQVKVQQDATVKALVPILEVLDTIDRAREHDEVVGGFASVVDQLERAVAAAGLVKFGVVGDAFDPNVHDALGSMGSDPEVSVETCKVIAKAGYKIGDRVVRAAQVLTVSPE